MDAAKKLDVVFDRDRDLDRSITDLLATGQGVALAAMRAAVERDRGAAGEDRERRLVRIAAIVSDLEGRAAAELVLELLDDPSPVVRTSAGEALLDIAVDGADEVMDAAQAAALRTDLVRALQELPYVLGEIEDGRNVRVIQKLLDHPDASVVASAIDTLVLLGDVASLPAIRRLEKDPRVAAHTDGEEEESVPLAVLAADAVETLGRGKGPGRPG